MKGPVGAGLLHRSHLSTPLIKEKQNNKNLQQKGKDLTGIMLAEPFPKDGSEPVTLP